MAIGVYFFKFPHNFVFGGVTGFAVVVAKVFPLTTGAFVSVASTREVFGKGFSNL